jgi:hypothetical protein
MGPVFIHQNLVVEPTIGHLSSRVMTGEGFPLILGVAVWLIWK